VAKKVNHRIEKILANCPKCSMPGNLVPMGLTLAKDPFDHKDWQFEIKWDGFRVLSYCSGNDVILSSKTNNSFNKRFPSIKNELERMNINAILDGEIVMLNEDGSPNFSNIISPGRTRLLVYYVFDILWYNGRNILDVPLYQRRQVLKSMLGNSEIVRFSDHIDEKGVDLFNLIQEHRVEGIVGKHKQSVYSPGYRTNQWLKIKTGYEVNAIIAGYMLDKDRNDTGFSSLIIGREIDSEYKYIGLVEAGVGIQTLKKVLEAKKTKKPIFAQEPKVNSKSPFRSPIKNPEIVWLRPGLKCQVKYLELDRFGLMRHASLKGLINE
jgi:bifunctional non-homologous end joining protein LigD